MISLTDRTWGAFPLKELFSVEHCKCSNVSQLKEGKMPYVGATNRNNGVLRFVENAPKLVTKGNCIVFICDGEGSVGYSIYKESDFIGSTTLKVGRSNSLNRRNGVFITTVADRVREKYNFGFKRSEPRLFNERLYLPVDEKAQPDWAFMEEYIREREENLVEEYKQYILNRYVIYAGGGQLLPLNQADWREFELCEIFPIIQRGKRLKTADHISGNKPYVSSSAMNNGVDNFVANKAGVREFGNCITIANSGSVGQAFYHPYNFVASDHVTQLKNDSLSRHMYTFLLPLISRLSEKYNFNHEINDVRIRREKILLPATDDGEPDWGYMDEYIREREDRLIREYKKYIGKYFQEREREREREGKNWKIFELSKVFTIRATSSSIDKVNLTGKGGGYPYVTRSDVNNGINDWITAQPAYELDGGNCITVGLDTQTAFYQSAPFYTGQNIQVFRSEHLNADNAQFIVPLLRNAMSVFSWGGNGATLTRLRRSKIMLPADEDGSPDWAFMTEYGAMVRGRQICAYIDYLKSRAKVK